MDKKAYLSRIPEPQAGTETAARPAAPSREKEKKVEPMTPPASEVSMVDINEFRRIQLKVGKIVAAERVEGARKLLKIQVDVGGEVRQIVSGIADKYAPEALLGKQILDVYGITSDVTAVRGDTDKARDALEVVIETDGDGADLPRIAGDLADRLRRGRVAVRRHRGNAEERQLYRLLSRGKPVTLAESAPGDAGPRGGG